MLAGLEGRQNLGGGVNRRCPLQKVKSNSSKHFNDESGLIRKFGWQEGYGAFTVSPNQTEVVIRYIRIGCGSRFRNKSNLSAL